MTIDLNQFVSYYYMIEHEHYEVFQWCHPQTDPWVVPEELKAQYVAFYRLFVPPGQDVIDIGTHVGHDTLVFGHIVGPEATVHAFEPNPYCYNVMRQMTEANSPRVKVEPHNLAATERTGKYTFHYSDQFFCNGGNAKETDAGIGAAGHQFPLEVEGVNVSELLFDRGPFGFIKTDTEGYDNQVLETLIPIIERDHPNLMTEMFMFSSRSEKWKMLSTLRDLGYKSMAIPLSTPTKDLPRELTLSDPEGLFDNLKPNDGHNIVSIHGSKL